MKRKLLKSNVTQNRGISILLILCVALATSIMLINTSLQTSLSESFLEPLKSYAGTSEYIVSVNTDKTSYSKKIFSSPDLAYAIPVSEKSMYIESNEGDQGGFFQVLGVELSGLDTYNPDSIAGLNLSGMSTEEIILSQSSAELLGITQGDTLFISDNGFVNLFTLVETTEPMGLFAHESSTHYAIVSPEAFANISNKADNVNKVFVKGRSGVELLPFLTSLPDGMIIEDSVNQNLNEQSSSMVTLPFQISGLLVYIMSVFIIYTSYKLILESKIPHIGTLRSIGATRKKTHLLLITELLSYALAGALVGIVLGGLVLFWMLNVQNTSISGFSNIRVTFELKNIVLSIIFSMGITFISSTVPIYSSTKKSIRALILDEPSLSPKNLTISIVSLLLFLVLVIVSLFLPQGLFGFIFSIVIMTLTIIFMALASPLFTHVVYRISKRINATKFTLAASNVEHSVDLRNNIKLISITVASVLLIFNIATSIETEMDKVYDNYHQYNVWGEVEADQPDLLDELASIETVTNRSLIKEYDNLLVTYSGERFVNTIYGLNNSNDFKYIQKSISPDELLLLDNLKDSNNIVLTTTIQEKWGISIGDELSIPMKEGSEPFIVSGFIESGFKVGNIGFIDITKFFKQDDLIHNRTYIQSDSSNDDLLITEITKNHSDSFLFLQTKSDVVSENAGSINGIFKIITTYSLIAATIGVIGIFSNAILSFLTRKKYLATMRSIGTDKLTLYSISLYENIFVGIIGVLTGLITSFAASRCIPYVLRFIFGSASASIHMPATIILSFSIVLISVIATLFPVFGIKRMNVVNVIKANNL